MQARKGNRWIKRVALGLAVASVLAPAAQAQEPYGELYRHDVVAPYSALYQHEFLPDGAPVAAVLLEAGATVATVSQAPAAHGELYQHPGAGLVTPTASGGFDWSDAGVGAGVALGALLLAAAAAFGVRRRGLTQSVPS